MFGLKIVIIGGGIAGLAAAIALKRNKNEVVVKEKTFTQNKSGMAFMIHENTVRNINSIGEKELDVINHEIRNVSLVASIRHDNVFTKLLRALLFIFF